MAIHHDKTAYGKLASAREDLSEERVLEMLRLLSETSKEAPQKNQSIENTEIAEKASRAPISETADKTVNANVDETAATTADKTADETVGETAAPTPSI